jgi:hypothetical protein
LTFLLDLSADSSPAIYSERLAAYREYLFAQRAVLPSAAFEFATALWHYDANDNRCPHDAWVESVAVLETGSGARSASRNLELRVRLLGAYQDGHIELRYPGLVSYSLSQPEVDPNFGAHGHGDWLTDEIAVVRGRAEQTLIEHRVVWSEGGAWVIRAADVQYDWLPLGSQQP